LQQTKIKFLLQGNPSQYINARVFLQRLYAQENTQNTIPTCSLVGNGRYEFVAISFSQVSEDVFLNFTYKKSKNKSNQLSPFLTGYMGLIPYNPILKKNNQRNIKAYRVNQTLIFDSKEKIIFCAGEAKQGDDWTVSINSVQNIINNKRTHGADHHQSLKGVQIHSGQSKDSYLDMISKTKNEIKSGRYYQANLLRYFTIDQPLSKQQIMMRMINLSESQGCFFDFDDYTIASFSPERFIQINRKEAQWKIIAQPIKGTIARGKTATEDRKNLSTLKNSSKDHNELNIIIDLMRNDLHRVSVTQSVSVISTGSIQSFAKVHHLVAEISGTLKEDISFKEIIQKLCPGGSITGAPKKEVMSAIAEKELQHRDLFMGNAFYLDDSGEFDSSILIRTLIGKESLVEKGQKDFFYAAGSGITISSSPEHEFKEIEEKCRVITDSIPMI
jgi:para-aminobenzoate synthetase component 1